MDYSARLEITTIQNGDEDKITAIGLVTINRDSVYVEFGEKDDKKTCIGISNKIVTITKFGESSYTLILEEGKTTGTTAILDEFKADLSIFTKAISFQKFSYGFNLDLAYTLTFNGNSIIENIVKIDCFYLN